MKKIINPRVSRDYQLLESFEAGIVLSGEEVKSVREGHISLIGSFVRVRGSEAWLHNANIYPYLHGQDENYDPSGARKLLLHRRELLKISQKIKEKKLTVVPVSCYIRHNKIKLEIALARGKAEYEKKEAAKKRDLQREIESSLKIKN